MNKEFADTVGLERIKRALEALGDDPECLNPLLITDEAFSETPRHDA